MYYKTIMDFKGDFFFGYFSTAPTEDHLFNEVDRYSLNYP